MTSKIVVLVCRSYLGECINKYTLSLRSLNIIRVYKLIVD